MMETWRSLPSRGVADGRPWWRRGLWWKVPVVLVLVMAALVGWSVVGAATTAGNENFSAKWADWLRAHDAAFLVTRAENYYYTHHAPAKGGQPASLNTLPPAPAPPVGTTTPPSGSPGPATTPTVALPVPSNVPLVVSPALSAEGVWQPAGPTVNGQAGMYVAQFRADPVYTSEITSAVWIDTRLLHLSLIPGLTEPGGTWPHPPYVTPAELPAAVAAFNGGFRFQDAKGGFWLDGVTAVPLRAGAASVVIYSDGHADIGAWGSEVTMTPDVAAVLQNLVPMVDNGRLQPSVFYTDHRVWGETLGGAVVVARSGIGVTADGALVYVAGPALTAQTLAESLQRAGAVRAMTLDINPNWVTFNFYQHPDTANLSDVVPAKLYPQMARPASRYLGPTEESRDFFLVSLPS